MGASESNSGPAIIHEILVTNIRNKFAIIKNTQSDQMMAVKISISSGCGRWITRLLMQQRLLVGNLFLL
jgi:hypothetical protein